jgi:predicted amidohydrolase
VFGERTAEGREEFLRYFKAAISIPSDATAEVEAIAARHGVFLVVGVVERDGGTLYCSVVFVDPERGLVGKHRKLVPTATERLVWGMGDASTLPVVDLPGVDEVKISAAVCW